jgi:hypothetical protein
VKNTLAKNQSADMFCDMLRTSSDMKLHLKSVSDAQEFFYNLQTLAKKTPDIFGVLAKNIPIIFI